MALAPIFDVYARQADRLLGPPLEYHALIDMATTGLLASDLLVTVRDTMPVAPANTRLLIQFDLALLRLKAAITWLQERGERAPLDEVQARVGTVCTSGTEMASILASLPVVRAA